ncbi:hypothetical protein BD408DRAFT_418805 [Parasitella parasitica]|nr:hypothetical protein BD408DRAFT_418805 [Parasitella parasitica]
MNFNLSFSDESWLFNDSNSSSNYGNELLQEPVPFEDFEFSFGINPDTNATPNIGDFPPPKISTNEPMSLDPLLLEQEPFNFAANTTVLDENDQRTFSSFLDAFFLDPDMQPDLNDGSSQEKEDEIRRSSILQSLDEQKKLHQTLNLIASFPPTNSRVTINAADLMIDPSSSSETSKGIVTSTSDDANQLQAIRLQPSDATSSSLYKFYNQQQPSKKRSPPTTVESVPLSCSRKNKKSRSTKELLTEEEKRANHIASEQKRRGTIRNGFKDLTDLVPTLKNINNSKSAVLFKAVDFIRYLEKRNKYLRDKVGSLELRVKVEGRMTGSNYTQQHLKEASTSPPSSQPQHLHSNAFYPIKHISYSPPNTPPPSQINKIPLNIVNTSLSETQFAKPLSPLLENNSSIYSSASNMSDSISAATAPTTTSNNNNNNHLMKGLPTNARNALLAHKTQQKQLLLLQEQLQMHQRLITQQQEMKEKSLSQHRQQASSQHTPKIKLPPILGQYDSSHQSSLLKELEDKAISAP